MKYILMGALLLGALNFAYSQSKYAVSLIPAPLLKNANSVVRENSLDFEILNAGKALQTEHKAITLLNDKAVDENEQYFWQSTLYDIIKVEGVVYDASGKLIRRLKDSDMTKGRPYQELFVDDYKYIKLSFPRLAFPYTIEYTVVTRYNGLLFYPVFEPQESPEQSVESAHFQIKAPDSMQVRVKTFLIGPEQTVGKYEWQFRNLEAYVPEPFLPLEYINRPRIVSAPTRFSMEGYEGDMSSWGNFGQFISKLNKGRSDLTPETVEKLRALTADCPDDRCKAAKIYDFLQQNTRYFNVSLGIGGWQPASASDVDKYKYGDCKGLSNYAVAMLRAVGLPAFYALIRAEEEEQQAQMPDFPNAWFNHATLCIPLPGDTIWLECTSQFESFGFLGTFTDDRPALVILPGGGQLWHTPRYDETLNAVERNTVLALHADGSGELSSNAVYRALAQENRLFLLDEPEAERKKLLYKSLNISNFEIKKLEISKRNTRIPESALQLELQLPQAASASGKRLFVPINFLSKTVELPLSNGSRRAPVQAHTRGVCEQDSLEIRIPDGFGVESLPESISLQNAFGSFERKTQRSGNRVVVFRKFVLNHSIQAPEQFPELEKLLKTAAKADHANLVLLLGS